MPTALQEAEERCNAKMKLLKTTIDQAKTSDGGVKWLQAEALRNLPDESAARQRFKELEEELAHEVKERDILRENIATTARMEQLIRDNESIPPENQHRHNGGNQANGSLVAVKDAGMSLGQLCQRDWHKGGGRRDVWLSKEYTDLELKAVLTTSATWAPETTRLPRVAEYASRPIQVIDQFPVGQTGQAAVSYMEETAQTNNAAEVAEGAAMPQSDFAATERTVIIKKIATYMTVTDEQLADVPQVQAMIDQRLRLFIMQRLDLQVLQGNGVGANITGLLNTAGIQTYARGAETNFDAIFRAIALVQLNGRASATGILVHPTNWTTIRLTTANGLYIFGPPSEAGVARLWGIPVSVTDIIPAGTAVVGDFAAHSQLVTRQGIEILAGYIADDFQKGQNSIRATMRAALVVYRPAAFATVTNLN